MKENAHTNIVKPTTNAVATIVDIDVVPNGSGKSLNDCSHAGPDVPNAHVQLPSDARTDEPLHIGIQKGADEPNTA